MKAQIMCRGVRWILTIVVALSIVVTFTMIPISRADTINPGLYSQDSKPYGLTFPQWSEAWWRWTVSAPDPINPLKDGTGKNCGINQNDPNVWYLTGTGSGKVIRECSIPSGKAILFQPAGTECSFAEFPNLKTEAELRMCAIAGDQVSSIHVSIDGRSIQSLQNYIVQTPLFNMTFPQNNIFGAPAGPTQSVSSAYLTFLEPLPPGNHDIHFDQVTLASPEAGTQSYAYDVEYHLTVQ